MKGNAGVNRAIFLGYTLDLCFVILLLSVLHCEGLMGFQTFFKRWQSIAWGRRAKVQDGISRQENYTLGHTSFTSFATVIGSNASDIK